MIPTQHMGSSRHVVQYSAKLQNTPPLACICTSMNKNSIYCYIPHSSKHTNTCNGWARVFCNRPQYPNRNICLRPYIRVTSVPDWHLSNISSKQYTVLYNHFLPGCVCLALEAVPREEQLASEALHLGPSVHLHHLLPEWSWRVIKWYLRVKWSCI